MAAASPQITIIFNVSKPVHRLYLAAAAARPAGAKAEAEAGGICARRSAPPLDDIYLASRPDSGTVCRPGEQLGKQEWNSWTRPISRPPGAAKRLLTSRLLVLGGT